ncbi:MAG: 5-methylcytosine-specific restriction protein A [Loktanella salsilacus]|jgi:5-methylcytosine-specific restriction protein A
MDLFKYHRMAPNSNDWIKPSPDRLGKSTDYLGSTGFGHEDWNFSRDIWEDGRHHLFLRQRPARKELRDNFFIALGDRTSFGHLLVGFAENAEYVDTKLSKRLAKRRAAHLRKLKEAGSLDGPYSKLNSDDEIANMLLREVEQCWVAVKPENLIILDYPVLIPDEIVGRKYNRYQLKRLTAEMYAELKHISSATPSILPDTDDEFPEGAQVEKLHRFRERDSSKVKQAKTRFIKANGRLSCEACDWRPEIAFELAVLMNKIIEAHHDIPLGSLEHSGATKASDLRMLCPNCHRAIHRIRPWLRVNEFREKFFPD